MRETETKRKREWEADGTEAQITIGDGKGTVGLTLESRRGRGPMGQEAPTRSRRGLLGPPGCSWREQATWGVAAALSAR